MVGNPKEAELTRKLELTYIMLTTSNHAAEY